MPKFIDFYSTPEVKEIMNSFVERFPKIFDGFKTDRINYVITRAKKSDRPIKLHSVGYPQHVFSGGKPYIVEVFNEWWKDMDRRQKNLSVFNIMCAIPENGAGFDEESKQYARKKKPEISMYMLEYAACGGVPNWMENPSGIDPMDREDDEIVCEFEKIDGEDIQRTPVLRSHIADA